MEAKLLSRKILTKPSGQQLLGLLALVLTGFVLLCDGVLGLLTHQTIGLTLPFALSAIASASLGFWVIPLLRKLKAAQVFQEDGPQSHLKKVGTPTMGGIFFVPVAVAIALIFSGFSANVLAVSLITLFYGLVGWLDDWQILRLKSNKGISPRAKLLFQFAGAIVFCLWMTFTQPNSITTVALPFGVAIPFGIFFWFLAVFVFAAESNATNITDGVDGLAGGTGAIALLGLAALIAPNSPDLAIFCASLSGGCLGFVFHNRNPAKVFMGDTGSLALGGALAAVGLLSQHLWGLFLLSGLFFVESLSVLAQVGYYKATKGPDGVGKRLFKMAPLHHHLEITGWQETQIVGAFYVLSCCLVLLTLILR
ncbi:phospho-N-acetylmuramoyl-pentapeptide-transferase [Spirulina subsalsa]|uniref:phospho-N-acetylmuramoyl-pentapeptide- transferase n=1 Tax=Spirulina subsalsa TaxID=54311 RepID=UPI00030F33C6|nr:phospho-N-acetylmuramoyl-pentapeptide-transferase [Spirulina subsalsa]